MPARVSPFWVGIVERSLLGLLAALAVLPAVIIGGVHAQTQVLTLFLSGLATALLSVHWKLTASLRAAQGSRRPVRVHRAGPLLWAMMVGLGATLFQLIPLPEAVLRVLSPYAAQLHTLSRESSAHSWHPLSLDPTA